MSVTDLVQEGVGNLSKLVDLLSPKDYAAFYRDIAEEQVDGAYVFNEAQRRALRGAADLIEASNYGTRPWGIVAPEEVSYYDGSDHHRLSANSVFRLEQGYIDGSVKALTMGLARRALPGAVFTHMDESQPDARVIRYAPDDWTAPWDEPGPISEEERARRADVRRIVDSSI